MTTAVKLTKHPFWKMHNVNPEPTDPVTRWRIEPLKDVFIDGFNVGQPNTKEYWRISGRNGDYNTAEQALAALQEEIDRKAATQP